MTMRRLQVSIMTNYQIFLNQHNLLLPTVPSIVPLADMFNIAADIGGDNVKCGYYDSVYEFMCWATRDIQTGEEVEMCNLA